ncbi:MAG TPA: hypothetical protein VF057_10160, partial [Thermoanaerobaculia bacterium]
RSVLILIDSLPRKGLVRKTVFPALERTMSQVMRPVDRAGIVFWEPGTARLRTLLEPTTDRRAVLTTLSRLAGTYQAATEAMPDFGEEEFFTEMEKIAAERGESYSAAPQIEASGRFAAELEILAFRRKTRAIGRLVRTLAARPGRKALLYVSQSFAMPENASARLAALAHVQELVKSANAAGVTIYALRPHVPDEEEGGLRELNRQLDTISRVVEPTGGRVDFGLTTVAPLIEQMAEDLQSYYSLAYRARSDGRDRERKIEVRTKNPNHVVRARTTFVEKSNETLARETLLTRLFTDEGGSDLLFFVDESEPKRSGSSRWLLPVRVRIPAAALQFENEGNDRVARVKVLIVSGNGVAEQTSINEDQLRVVQGKHIDPQGFVNYSVQILVDKRGSEVSIGVFDERSGLVGVKTIDNRGRFGPSAAAR